MKLTSRRKFLGIVLLSAAANLFHGAAKASLVGEQLDPEAQEHFKAMLGKAAKIDDSELQSEPEDHVSFADGNSEDGEDYQAASNDGEDYQSSLYDGGDEADFERAGFDEGSYNQADFNGEEEDY